MDTITVMKTCQLRTFDIIENNKIIVFTTTHGEPTEEIIDEFGLLFQEAIDSFDGDFVCYLIYQAGKLQKEIEEKNAARYKYNFIVFKNSIISMLLKGVNLVSKPAIEQKVFKSYSEAEKEAIKMVSSWRKRIQYLIFLIFHIQE